VVDLGKNLKPATWWWALVAHLVNWHADQVGEHRLGHQARVWISLDGSSKGTTVASNDHTFPGHVRFSETTEVAQYRKCRFQALRERFFSGGIGCGDTVPNLTECVGHHVRGQALAQDVE
jgi:hypothetical protein